MIQRRIKRLWHNLASVRDYEVKSAIENNEPIRLSLVRDGKIHTMTLSVDKLKKGFSISPKKFKSLFNDGEDYELIDFRWVDDKESDKQLEMFNVKS
jgi:hypothetical protein